MSRIRPLPSDVINKIAAGEVVERPASVVKELVENSLDAGATRIEVDLDGGGRDRIQVVDDGRGMDREDALACIERHATSKLRDAEGLFHLASFGFRGEAIPAIASVSRMVLTTREPEALEGMRIEIEGGVVRSAEACGAPRGTSFTIRDLFYATPARRKFLKRPETEASHSTETLIRLALGRPDVAFTLRSGGRVAFQSGASPDLRERIAAALGKEIHPHLVPVEHVRGTVAVRGHVASPAWSAATARAVYTFVNGRCIRDRQLMHAIQRAYEGLLPQGRMPGGVLFLEIPPHEVDVNVHPQKLEVRFAEPRGVYDALLRAVSDALGRSKWLGAAAPDPAPEAAGKAYAVPASPQPSFDWQTAARYRPQAQPQFQQQGAGIREAAQALWPREGDPALLAGALLAGAVPSAKGPEELSGLRFIGQLGPAFLLCESASGGLAVMDLHACRERIAWSRLRRQVDEGQVAGKPFLFPMIVDLPAPDARLLAATLERARELGFDLEPFGGTTFALKAAPSLMAGADWDRLLADLARALDGRDRPEALAAGLSVIACQAAMLDQKALSEDEARALLDELASGDPEPRCLHGKPVVLEVSLTELARRAGWLQPDQLASGASASAAPGRPRSESPQA
ncbi:DNA mismatch repair endonuclease MutL [Vulgatibacter incomptus]|uniref:DNA mismatch repair protein MutL n=1 Tax=Vulgatibacter incomptus TaxID=1391653 RepID=A0A0K1PA28_9BACT|nr:DNA mismatch repair endonuclease MutL [Vulgatibacter incomptus]AKU90393.1 DNA mismatch repair protein MutL [Vulgatibacter incomptus]